ncbi:MAG TPA: hypothetical protein PK467_11945 [Candidatus Wallbacteria bacterium]|nr:hypothetical protein [Candidatus Wallbacteria bacterium]
MSLNQKCANPCGKGMLASNLAVYGAAHAFVDMSCAATLMSLALRSTPSDACVYILTYNIIAFGTQPISGMLSDSSRSPVIFAAAGCFITALAAFLAGSFPLITACGAGIGNSLFHVGAGAVCISLRPDEAAPAGIFVAPGAFGLTAGSLMGKTGAYNPAALALILVAFALSFSLLKRPEIAFAAPSSPAAFEGFETALFLFLLTVVMRAFTGFFVNFPWKSDPNLLLLLTLAIVAGKAFGGIAADRFGWREITIGGLLASSALITFAGGSAPCAIAGILLFNMTMPVTLVAVSKLLPGRPAFSLGLTCLALILGALPAFYTGPAKTPVAVITAFAGVLLSAAVMYKALKIYFDRMVPRTKSESREV